MHNKKRLWQLCCLFMLIGQVIFMCNDVQGYTISSKDTSATQSLDSIHSTGFLYKNLYKELIIPIGFTAYGIIAQENHLLKYNDMSVREEVLEKQRDKIMLDDFLQYAGTTAFFALDAFGVKPAHNLRQRIFTGAISYAIMAATVNTMKSTIPVWRPDSSAVNSFPSGHTATSFVGAELMWQEYHEQSVWLGLSGYAVAAATGFFRMYNNKHWLSDVSMGAGIGILSTKVTYWLLPLLDHRLTRMKKNYVLLPAYNGQQIGFSACMNF